MRKALISLTAITLVGASAVAIASDDSRRRMPADDWLSLAAIAGKLSEQGFNVRELEVDDGLYEAKAYDASGTYLKLKIDPRTGEVISRRTRR
jgi:hypothetical protein